jgi:hypothetical protein
MLYYILNAYVCLTCFKRSLPILSLIIHHLTILYLTYVPEERTAPLAKQGLNPHPQLPYITEGACSLAFFCFVQTTVREIQKLFVL